MLKNLTFTILVSALTLGASAQTAAPATQAFGKIDQADLDLKACEFEKEANAMVLFSKCEMYYDHSFNVILETHRRVKIFNRKGEDEAKVRIEYDGGNRYEYISGLQAETINPGEGKPEFTKLDKKQIFTEHVDKVEDAIIFTFPNVKPGSVIEYKYTRTINSMRNIPAWFFQEDIPVRYSELSTTIPEYFTFSTKTNGANFSKYTTDTKSQSIGSGQDLLSFLEYNTIRGMSNIHSLPDEPYMSSSNDNLQSIHFTLSSIRPVNAMVRTYPDSWATVGGAIADDEDFGLQIKKKLANEEEIITKAKALKTDDARIAYVFNAVRDAMKWNSVDRWYTTDGIKTAWEKKTGNATEINLALCHLLKQAGVKAYPMIVSTRSHGKVNPGYPFIYQFNRAVTYIPVDSNRRYVLDASNKYNAYNEIPSNLLNSYGLCISKEDKTYDIVSLQNPNLVTQNIFVQAQITPKGQVDGTAQISCSSYNRFSAIQSYKTDGEKKYIDYLRGNNNNITISGLKMQNMEVDTLPLTQQMDIKTDLTGSDDNYIYLSPNLFATLNSNPFLSENRYSDIDFGYKKMYTISGLFKMPEGFKVDAMPKNISMTMPDKSITFRRTIASQEGNLVVRYVITYNQSVYSKDNYPEMHEFHKKMQEMLNEQIVLKKG